MNHLRDMHVSCLEEVHQNQYKRTSYRHSNSRWNETKKAILADL